MKGDVTNIQRFSVHDGPGIRSTVFLKGCPLSCIWCQNPEAMSRNPDIMHFQDQCIGCQKCVALCPHDCFKWQGKTEFRSNKCDRCGLCIEACPVCALRWTSYEINSYEVIAEVLKDKVFYDLSNGGVTLSGGEPLYQTMFCLDLAKKSKEQGLHVVLDTSGNIATESFMTVLPYIDLFLYDIKFIDNDLHKKYTGVSNQIILKNFHILCEADRNIKIRTPLIPGITDKDENLSKIKSFVKNCSSQIELEFIPFNNLTVEKYRMLGKICAVKKD